MTSMKILDSESETFLHLLAEQQKTLHHRFAGIKTVLVVLSGSGMVFDIESLRQKIRLAYSQSTVYFCTPHFTPLGTPLPESIDLLIDFTSSTDQENFFHAKKLRRLSRVAVGRNINFLRRRLYDRLLNEKIFYSKFSTSWIDRERAIQQGVLALAGIPFAQQGDSALNSESTIAASLENR